MSRRSAAYLLSALVILVTLAFGSGLPIHVRSAWPASTGAIETEATIEFPRGMRFTAEIPVPADAAIDHADLLYRLGDDETLHLAVVPEESLVATHDTVSVEVFVDMQQTFVPAGVELTYHWELSANGAIAQVTPDETTMWMDDRFEWRTIRSEQVVLHSYGLSNIFAQQVVERAQATISELEGRYELGPLRPITVWVYASLEDLSGTQQANSREAIAGLSYPDVSTTTVIIPEGSDRELGRVLPHEVSHLALSQATDNPFTRPPLWFDEGLATHVQDGGTSAYLETVIRAEAEDALFSISSLEVTFPFQPAQATLAYASSWSMVAYIGETYGDAGIARLIAAFGDGLATDAAISIALGVTEAELDAAWHAWVREQGEVSDIAA